MSDQHASLILYLFNNEYIWILLCVNLPDYTIGVCTIVCTIVCTATSASLRQATKGGGRDNAESRQTGRQDDQSGATFPPILPVLVLSSYLQSQSPIYGTCLLPCAVM